MRVSFLSAALAAWSLTTLAANAQTSQDTTIVNHLEASVVQGVRVSKDAPFAVSNVNRKALSDFSSSGKEILEKGDSLFVPAGYGPYWLRGHGRFLLTMV